MKVATIALLFLSLVLGSFAAELATLEQQSILCPLCVQESVALINVLLNGVLGKSISTCGDLCSYATTPFEQKICDYTCDALGLAAFIKLLEDDGKDIDFIYLCEIVDMCPKEACTGKCLDITKFEVAPKQVVIGGDIVNQITIQEYKPWNGTGMFRYDLTGPGDVHIQNDQLLQGGWSIGAPQTMVFKYPTKIPKGSNDPPFSEGTYQAVVQICDGSCGSTYPDSRLLATASTTFTMIRGNNGEFEIAETEEVEVEPLMLVDDNKRGFLKKIGKGIKKVVKGSKCGICKTVVSILKKQYNGNPSSINNIIDKACGKIPIAGALCSSFLKSKAQKIAGYLQDGDSTSQICGLIKAC
eukprot:TRINITY_DN12258_c0_g1_i1.p1 TRINITY_DN12258_c0_g1~~TRINITY_DN12258_c0_g1_i1.p1  ORF type:complete len:356 (-),score=110.03 TRINITY_DN12258_c0_g1_i1:187-1254(-)